MWGSLKLVNLHTREAGMHVKGIPRLTRGFQTPPPPLANGAPKENGGYHQGVRTWTPVEYSKLLPSTLPQSASPPTLVVFILGRKLAVKQ